MTVREAGGIIARLPFAFKPRYGFKIAGNPRFTQTLGPWIKPEEGSPTRNIARRIDLTQQLLVQLPSVDVFSQTLAANYLDPLPFHWSGFDNSISITYRLRDLSDLDRVWNGLTKHCRNTIRKAQRSLVVVQEEDSERFCDVADLTFTRQGIPSPLHRATLARIAAAGREREAVRMWKAVDAFERTHAAAMIVSDPRGAYYIAGGADPEWRHSGAQALLLWHSISTTAPSAALFDFEGSMHAGIEHFFRSFGGGQQSLLRVTRVSPRMRALTGGKLIAESVTRRRIPWFY